MPKTNKTIEQRFWEKVEKRGGNKCWPWKGSLDSSGYGSFNYNGKISRAHRIACLLLNKKIPDGLCVCHQCDNPACINPAHFFFGTTGDNNRDRHVKGRSRGKSWKGASHPMARFTEEQIKEIYLSTDTAKAVARRFDTNPSHIDHIRNGRAWRSVTQTMSKQRGSL